MSVVGHTEPDPKKASELVSKADLFQFCTALLDSDLNMSNAILALLVNDRDAAIQAMREEVERVQKLRDEVFALVGVRRLSEDGE